ncbi:MAG: rRNA maturation RNase YbeY [Flavobacteriales bacterium]|jgi:probable rRNA maturation factor
MAIFFHTIDVRLDLKHKNALKRWIKASIEAESKQPGEINIIFCSDNHLLEMNREHLQHDYYTDIITFDFSNDRIVSGDLYISLDRVKDNAHKNSTLLQNETYLVIIHGIMHLCGYKDKQKLEIQTMRQKETFYLKKLSDFL